MLGDHYRAETASVLRRQLGLDRPILHGYLHWIGNALRGDLGKSIRSGHAILETLRDRLRISFPLSGLALMIAVGIGLPLGIVAGVYRYNAVGYLCNVFALIGISTPSHWLSFLLILLFSVTLRWLPPSGFIRFTADPLGWLRHMTLPAFTLGLITAAGIMRITRSSVLEVLSQQYVQTARSKGVRELKVVAKHVLRNAFIPVLTIIGLNAGYLIGTAVVVELVFGLPGLGRLALTGITQRDYPVVQGVVLVMTMLFVFINLLVDMIYGVIDPRIRYD